jgi:transketolase
MLNPRLYRKSVERIPTRNGYGEGLVLAGKGDDNVVVLCCDLTESTRSHLFAKEFPDRFVQCGVAEQNMAGVAAGLAQEGKVPFISSYAVFSPGRNWDQIRVSGCYNKANIKICGAHAGISVGPDGATHQALEDIAITRVLPGMTVIAPCDVHEARKATVAAAKMKGPVYMRFAREKTPVITTEKTPFTIGRAQVLQEGRDVTIIACGPLVYESLVAAKMLKQEKISAEVINCATIKPLDVKTILASAKKTRAIVTVEEHQISGGLGGAVAEALSSRYPVPVMRVGMPDSFGESGPPDELLKKYGMTATDILRASTKAMKIKVKYTVL